MKTVIRPSKINYISHMSSKLAGIGPLWCFLSFAKLFGAHFEWPDNYKLIVSSRGQILSAWWEPYTVNCWRMTALQVIHMIDYKSIKLPESYTSVVFSVKWWCYDVIGVRVVINGHDAWCFIMPTNLRDINLHYFSLIKYLFNWIN